MPIENSHKLQPPRTAEERWYRTQAALRLDLADARRDLDHIDAYARDIAIWMGKHDRPFAEVCAGHASDILERLRRQAARQSAGPEIQRIVATAELRGKEIVNMLASKTQANSQANRKQIASRGGS